MWTQLTVFALLAVSLNAKQVCYDNGVGCFSDDPPWDNMPLPLDPADMPITYMLMMGGGNYTVITSPDQLKLDKLIIMTHGFHGTYDNTIAPEGKWGNKISSNLIKTRPDHDVLFIDWGKGSDFGKGLNLHHQPASNTRVIGKMVAMWLQNSTNFNSSKVHCIGFSLGAHVCGMIAKRMGTKWGRLSAVDPAGPAFMKDDPVARVDKSDGVVVDVLHASWVSIKRPIGHKDFYVNNGNVQPGCFSKRKRRSTIQDQEDLIKELVRSSATAYVDLGDIFDVLGCSHYRAALLYAETILERSDCKFPACRCPTQEHFNKGHCRQCDLAKDGQLLGFHSDKYDNQGIFYAATSDKEPYCL